MNACLPLIVIHSPDADLLQMAVAQKLPDFQDLQTGIRVLAQDLSKILLHRQFHAPVS